MSKVDKIKNVHITEISNLIKICTKHKINNLKMLSEIKKEIILSDNYEDQLNIIYDYNSVKEKVLKEYITKKYDIEYYLQCKLYCTIILGTGGNDAKDLTERIFNLYKSYFEKLKCINSVNNTTLTIELNNVYLFCKMLEVDHITYKVIRFSPFNNKRQTSFLKTHFYEIYENELETEINNNDIVIQISKSSGSGGQHVNKTESKVKIIHKKTGINVTCSKTRSQVKNKEIALIELKKRIKEIKDLQIEYKKKKDYINFFKISWSNFTCIINLTQDSFIKYSKFNFKQKIKSITCINLHKMHNSFLHQNNYLKN